MDPTNLPPHFVVVERFVGDALSWKRVAAAYPGRTDSHHSGVYYLRSDGGEMDDEEIVRLLKENPITLWNGFIQDGNNRIIAMISRLRRGMSYLPLYYEEYDESSLRSNGNGSSDCDGNIVGDITG